MNHMNIKLGIVGFGFMGHCDADMLAAAGRGGD